MISVFTKSLRIAIAVFVMASIMCACVPLSGCAKKEKSPEEVEKSRIEHGERAARELEEG